MLSACSRRAPERATWSHLSPLGPSQPRWLDRPPPPAKRGLTPTEGNRAGPAREVEGLVGRMARGGSGPLGRTSKALLHAGASFLVNSISALAGPSTVYPSSESVPSSATRRASASRQRPAQGASRNSGRRGRNPTWSTRSSAGVDRPGGPPRRGASAWRRARSSTLGSGGHPTVAAGRRKARSAVLGPPAAYRSTSWVAQLPENNDPSAARPPGFGSVRQ